MFFKFRILFFLSFFILNCNGQRLNKQKCITSDDCKKLDDGNICTTVNCINDYCKILNEDTKKCGEDKWCLNGECTSTCSIKADKIWSSYNTTCAKINAETICWGSNKASRLLIDQDISESMVPIKFDYFSKNIKKILHADDYSCALFDDATVKCWGVLNGISQPPSEISGIDDAIDISITMSPTKSICIINSQNKLRCWGFNGHAELGDGTLTNRYNSAVDVLIDEKATSISLGVHYSCALLEDETVKGWGTHKAEPIKIPVLVNNLSGVKKISSGGYHRCALLGDKTIKCWGSNFDGQLGIGKDVGYYGATLVKNIDTAIDISCGGYHTCALLEDKTVKCWGNNNFGQLAYNNYTVGKNTPQSVYGLNNVEQISLGWNHTCALLSDKTIKCWGDNRYGQLGDGISNSYVKLADQNVRNFDFKKNICSVDNPPYQFSHCVSDAQCPKDNFCRDNYCDLDNFKCAFKSLNINKFCEKKTYSEGLGEYEEFAHTCSENASCVFNPIILGLCANNIHKISDPAPTGIILPITVKENFNLNNDENFLAIATKFTKDDDQFICGGAHFMNSVSGIVFSVFGDDNSTEIKDGFSPNEKINVFIRTDKHICRVETQLDTSDPYNCKSLKWAPLSLCKIAKILDYTDKTEKINFSNTDNCVDYTNMN